MSGATVTTLPWRRQLYERAEDVLKQSDTLHHSFLVHRTLSGEYPQFRASKILYVGRSPAAYIIDVDTFNEEHIRVWHRFLWNQGVVPLLIISTKTQIRVYTAYSKPEKPGSNQRIATILEDTADALEVIQTKIEAGTIYEEHPKAFQRSGGVDRYLIENLNAAAQLLAKTQAGGADKKDSLEFAHRFLMRLLFVCYLIERGMIKGEHFDRPELKRLKTANGDEKGYFLRDLFDDLTTREKKKEALCHIFERVKNRFNGSLFPEDFSAEINQYNDKFIGIVDDFLHWHNLAAGQYMLDFCAYDFSVIPIETISAVYENFLGVQGEIQRKTGAYYTPLHLAEMTVDIALEGINKPIHELKVLDPACGSGVFLVTLFGRMAQSLRREENPAGISDRKFIRRLSSVLGQLYGVDISPTACHITCFSLYLALLEQLQPTDIEELCSYNTNRRALRPLLVGNKKGFETIYHGDFLDEAIPFTGMNFDLVIGNPPWVSRSKLSDAFEGWCKRNRQLPVPLKQIAHGFMWETPKYLGQQGIGCLLLPAAVLLNSSTNEFQAKWLNECGVDRVVNFSDLRRVLFSSAIHPCVVVRFRARGGTENGEVLYEVPKIDRRSQTGGSVFVREEDTSKIRLREILTKAKEGRAPLIWKSHSWGTWRDRRLLMRLLDFPVLGKVRKQNNWITGQGIQVGGGDPNNGWWNESTPYLDVRAVSDLCICDSALMTTRQAQIPMIVHRPRDPSLFRGPKVLFSKGSRKVIYTSELVLFRDTFTAITGKREDESVLQFLNAVLGSDLAYYFLFHTNANLGIYRPQVYPEDFMLIPFFLPKDAIDPKKAEEIVKKAAQAIRDFGETLKREVCFDRSEEEEKVRHNVLEPLVREYYDIDEYEAMLIEDTMTLAIPSSTPGQSKEDLPTLRIPNDADCQAYRKTLCEMMNHFGKGSRLKVHGNVLMGDPYSVVQLSLGDTAVKRVEFEKAEAGLTAAMKKMGSLLEEKDGQFVFCKNLKVFDGSDLYLLKPMQMRFWSRTAALNDADEIAGAILDKKGKE
jgi:hypothetical protein